MSDMNTVAEEEIGAREEAMARAHADLMSNPNEVVVSIPVATIDGIMVPHYAGEREEKAIFKVMSFGDYMLMEKACRYAQEREDGKKIYEVDFNEVRRLSLKRNLLSWSLDIPVERANGWMTPEAYERVGEVCGPLMEAFLDGFWMKSELTKDEEDEMERQASVLFGKHSRGVSNPCEAVRLYCTMGSQWDKFGIKEEELDDMSYRKYIMLKKMVSYENEAMKRQSAAKKPANTRIAGAGGRTRVSQGQRIAL
ncbi:MAG: hypothetical protein ACXABY_24125 [Candidatus Thorarchaeota archaeon]|jgi:hypothetical protein